jgi:hypothetical protein
MFKKDHLGRQNNVRAQPVFLICSYILLTTEPVSSAIGTKRFLSLFWSNCVGTDDDGSYRVTSPLIPVIVLCVGMLLP